MAKPQDFDKTKQSLDEKTERLTEGVAAALDKEIVPGENLPIDDNFDASPQQFINLFPDNQIVSRKEPLTKQEKYYAELAHQDQMDMIVPRGKMKTSVWVLSALARKLLYPNLTVSYWDSIVCDVEKLLKMHILRLESKEITYEPLEAMRIVARGIYLAHREIKKHPEKYHNGMPKYMPKQYFRLNNLILKAGSKLKNGRILEDDLTIVPQFKNVMDTWIPNERARLSKLAAQNSQFMAWQIATYREELFFERIVTELAKEKTKVSQAMTFAHQAKQGLIDIFKENNLKESTQREVMYSFQSKVTAITESLKEGADALQYQKWETFADAFKNAA